MDKYFDFYREMISLRGPTDHTLRSYSTYIRSYLDYQKNILHKSPDNVSWHELRDFRKNVISQTGQSTLLFRSCVFSHLCSS